SRVAARHRPLHCRTRFVDYRSFAAYRSVQQMRVLIIGVGGVGAMAAWRLAKAGHEVVALEQFRLDHDRGSSFGDSRIVRRVYPDALYTALMADAYSLWEELQACFPDQTLFVRPGGIFCGPIDDPRI